MGSRHKKLASQSIQEAKTSPTAPGIIRSFVDRSWKATGLTSFQLPLGYRFNSCHPDFFQKQALRTRSRAIPRPFLPSGEGHLERRPVAGAEEWAAGRREWATGRWGFAAV